MVVLLGKGLDQSSAVDKTGAPSTTSQSGMPHPFRLQANIRHPDVSFLSIVEIMADKIRTKQGAMRVSQTTLLHFDMQQ